MKAFGIWNLLWLIKRIVFSFKWFVRCFLTLSFFVIVEAFMQIKLIKKHKDKTITNGIRGFNMVWPTIPSDEKIQKHRQNINDILDIEGGWNEIDH